MKFTSLFRRLAHRIRLRTLNVKVWGDCNIYPTAVFEGNNSVGYGCEIGDHVQIGEGTRIGALSYIPSGVMIGRHCFIGPRFCATNDRYPPSPRDKWEDIYILDGAKIGAAVTIIPGVVIGKNAVIGAGSVVTKVVPANEVWAGVPAKKIRSINGTR